MEERASLVQIADWLVGKGVDPGVLLSDRLSAGPMQQTYLSLPAGWRDSEPREVLGFLVGAQPQQYTNEAGDGPPPAEGVTAQEFLDLSRLAPPGDPAPPDVAVAPADTGSSFDVGLRNGVGFASPDLPSAGGAVLPALPGGGLPDVASILSAAESPQSMTVTPALAGGVAPQGRGYQQQVHVPGGPSAGPFDTSAAPMPAPEYSAGGSSGGGGGGASDLYWDLRNALTGGGSSGYSGYSSGYGGGGYETPEYNYQKNRGAAKKYDEEQLNETIEYYPSAILPTIEDPSTNNYGRLRELDAANLVALGVGGRKQFYKKDRTNKYGYVTPGKLKQSTYTNALADMYSDIKAGQGSWLDADQMYANLLGAKKKSYLGQQFRGKDTTVASQAAAFMNYMETIAANSGNSVREAGIISQAQRDADAWAAKRLKKKNPGSLTKAIKKGRV